MKVYVKPDNLNLKKVEDVLDEIKSLTSTYLDATDQSNYNQENYLLLMRFKDSVIEKFRNEISKENNLLENPIFFESVMNDLENIAGIFRYNVINPDDLKFSVTSLNMVNASRNIYNITRDLQMMRATSIRISEMVQPAVDRGLNEVKRTVNKIDAALLAIEQNETDKIYLELSEKYKWEYMRNNFYFFLTLIIAGLISFYNSMSVAEIAKLIEKELIIFISIKLILVTITITITLCTLFLRRSSHAKKFQDQAYQTHIEISAFPIHVRSLKEEDKHELVKELTMKYFGKELDQTQNDKIGDLMQNQIAAGTELIKASAEMLKAKSESN